MVSIDKKVTSVAIALALPLAVALLLAVVGMVVAFCSIHSRVSSDALPDEAAIADLVADDSASNPPADTPSSDNPSAPSAVTASTSHSSDSSLAYTDLSVDPEAVQSIAATVAAIAEEVQRLQGGEGAADIDGGAVANSGVSDVSAVAQADNKAAGGAQASLIDASSGAVAASGEPPQLTQDIMGTGIIPASAMVALYNQHGSQYPASVYEQAGAPTIENFVALCVEECEAEGVKPEVLFAQIMHETAWLQFGNQVNVEQNNFGGLGATNDGSEGATFASVREGLRAQVQHLKAYASTSDVVNDVVDPRFDLVSRGSAPTVEDLGGTWAVPGDTYGEALMNIIEQLYVLAYPESVEGA